MVKKAEAVSSLKAKGCVGCDLDQGQMAIPDHMWIDSTCTIITAHCDTCTPQNKQYNTTSVCSHAAPHLVAAGDAGQLVTGPHTQDGADGEVGVNNGGAVQGVEGDGEARSAHVDGLGDLLRAGPLADVLQAHSRKSHETHVDSVAISMAAWQYDKKNMQRSHQQPGAT